MKITNNEGQTILVSEIAFSALAAAYEKGVWVCYVKDLQGFSHKVVLPDNF